MEAGGAPANLAVKPEDLVFRLRWSEVQMLNRARQTSGSRWAADARWRIYPLMLFLLGAYSLFSFGVGRAWLLGMLGLSLTAGVFLAFPGLFTAWARLPVLHWTIFDPVAVALRRTVDLDAGGMNVHGWHGQMRVTWAELDGCECSPAGLTVHRGLQVWFLPARAFSSRASFEGYAALVSDALGEAMGRR